MNSFLALKTLQNFIRYVPPPLPLYLYNAVPPPDVPEHLTSIHIS